MKNFIKDFILKFILSFVVFILTIKFLECLEFKQFSVGFFSCLMIQNAYSFYEEFIED